MHSFIPCIYLETSVLVAEVYIKFSANILAIAAGVIAPYTYPYTILTLSLYGIMIYDSITIMIPLWNANISTLLITPKRMGLHCEVAG